MNEVLYFDASDALRTYGAAYPLIFAARKILRDVESGARADTLYKAVSSFVENGKDLVPLFQSHDASVSEQAYGQTLATALRQLDKLLTWHECGVRALDPEKVQKILRSWIATEVVPEPMVA